MKNKPGKPKGAPNCFGDYTPDDPKCEKCPWDKIGIKWTCENELMEWDDDGPDCDGF